MNSSHFSEEVMMILLIPAEIFWAWRKSDSYRGTANPDGLWLGLLFHMQPVLLQPWHCHLFYAAFYTYLSLKIETIHLVLSGLEPRTSSVGNPCHFLLNISSVKEASERNEKWFWGKRPVSLHFKNNPLLSFLFVLLRIYPVNILKHVYLLRISSSKSVEKKGCFLEFRLMIPLNFSYKLECFTTQKLEYEEWCQQRGGISWRVVAPSAWPMISPSIKPTTLFSMVVRLAPDQSVACSIHVGFKIPVMNWIDSFPVCGSMLWYVVVVVVS